MAAQRLEEGLKASGHYAPENRAIDLDLAHPRSALHLAHGGSSNKSHLDLLHGRLLRHDARLGIAAQAEIVRIDDRIRSQR